MDNLLGGTHMVACGNRPFLTREVQGGSGGDGRVAWVRTISVRWGGLACYSHAELGVEAPGGSGDAAPLPLPLRLRG